jgi:serine/threonine-protein kinase RsbT
VSAVLTEKHVVDLLARHVSRINASVIVERGRRILRRPGRIEPDEQARFFEAVRSSASLFANAVEMAALLRDLVALEHDGVAEEVPGPMTIAVEREPDLRAARLAARELCERFGAPGFVVHRVATAVSELARNIVAYTRGGRITFSPQSGPPPTLHIVAEDEGPGIARIEEILGGRYRSKTGLGRGLLGVKQLMEQFDVRTGPHGTRITVEARLR